MEFPAILPILHTLGTNHLHYYYFTLAVFAGSLLRADAFGSVKRIIVCFPLLFLFDCLWFVS